MMSLNSSSVDVGARTAIVEAEKEGQVEIDISRAGSAGAGTLTTGIPLGLTDGDVVVFDLERVELLEQEDLWEPLADLIGPAGASLLATL